MLKEENGWTRVRGCFPGELPVRVMQHNIIDCFLRGNQHAASSWQELAVQGKLCNEITLLIDHMPVRSPAIDHANGKIHFQETFMAALWATCYGYLVLHNDVATNYRQGKRVSQNDRSDPNVREAFDLLVYAESLFREYSDWPRELPQPEHYRSDNDFIGKANDLYQTAAAFTLAHEFAHCALEHGASEYNTLRAKARGNQHLSEEERATLRQLENEADVYAIGHFMTLSDDAEEKTIRLFGMVMVFLCFLLGKADAQDFQPYSHPDLGTRLLNLLSREIDDIEWRHCLEGVVFQGLCHFLHRVGVEMAGVELEDPREGIEWCLKQIDQRSRPEM